MKKKILGLDLGSASIGWALINESTENEITTSEILGIGARIIPYDGTEGKDFAKGSGETRNSLRTTARTARKGYDRYQLRRKYLIETLIKHGMMPGEDLKFLPKLKLWEIRSKAAISQISITELGRILLWLNQKRGYKSSRSVSNKDKKDTNYVANVKSRHERIKDLNLTIGQYFFNELIKDEFFRVKDNIFPREAYIEEFNLICKTQQQFYPEILTDELITIIRDEIIYFQRQLKSQKGLVSVCEFEGFWRKNGDGKEHFVGPRVAAKSSPLFQVAKIWESINNIKISDHHGNDIEISPDQKIALFNYLDNNEKLSQNELFKILKIKKEDYIVGKQVVNGIQGNITKCLILKYFEGLNEYNHLLNFGLSVGTLSAEGYLYDKKTGEIINIKPLKQVSTNIEHEPFYQLWHVIYSIKDFEDCSKTLQKKFRLHEDVAQKLANIDFEKFGFGNKSAKVIRRILPYLIEGDQYSQAMSYAGYDHSDSMTKDENLKRQLLEKLKPLEKNSLRQPIVEKILNQMINLVNAIIEKYGKPDEIRIELARELKQSKEERSETEQAINKRQRENVEISKRLTEYGLRATRNNILKWRLYEEIDNKDKKLNAICIYCGQPISLLEAIKGNDVDIEHIIPKSRLFDDSQSNKTLAHRHCNKDKNDRTAYDFMKSKSENSFIEYVDRINMLYSRHVINKTKRDKLLMTESKIPDNFIDRQLRESQYISKKAREILQTICHHVWCTSGNVTAELRHLWGWDDITMNLQLPKYKELGLTEFVEWESENGNRRHIKEVISGWTKRDDHRHHAIDALTIACTKQGFIQRFNTLNATKTREDMFAEVEKRSDLFREKLSLLEKFIISQKPISSDIVQEHISKILISFKAGKKVAVLGKRKIGKRGNKTVVQTGIIIPRGPLSEESVYGKIKTIVKQKPLKFLFENPHLIFKPYIKELVDKRLEDYKGDIKNAFASTKKKPIYLDNEKKMILEQATCFQEEYVIKYPVNTNFTKLDKVIDLKVKSILESRLNKFNGKSKEAFKDVQKDDKSIKWYEDEGLIRPIRTVRCFTGLAAVVPVKKDLKGNDIGFVKPGNNHHIAIYEDDAGKKHEHICTFWHAVERKKYMIPVIIQNTTQVWDKILAEPNGTFKQDFIDKLPNPEWHLVISLQQNEMIFIGMEREEIQTAINEDNLSKLSEKLYRVQKLTIIPSSGQLDVTLRHHLETQIIDNRESLTNKRYIKIQSLGSLFSLKPIKVKIDRLGDSQLLSH